jgi:hypothetical protein
MLLLGNIGQQMDLDDVQEEIADLRSRLRTSRINAEAVDRETDRLAAENDELRLYVAAILRVLVAKQVVSRDELVDLVRTVDAEDGAVDNAHSGPLLTPDDDAEGQSR